MTTRRLIVIAVGIVVLLVVVISSDQAGERRAEQAEPPTATTGREPLAGCTGTQLELNTCAAEELEQTEATLDAVLAEVRSFVSTSRRPVLDDSQQQWVSYSDTFCGAFTLDDGSIQPLNVLTCKINMTRQRAVDVCAWALPTADLDAVVDPPETCRGLRA